MDYNGNRILLQDNNIIHSSDSENTESEMISEIIQCAQTNVKCILTEFNSNWNCTIINKCML